MNIIKTLYIIILVRLCCGKKSTTASTYLSVVRTGPCRVRKASEVVIFSEMSMYQEKGHLGTLSGEIDVLKDIEDGWSAKTVMEKCHDMRNLDTCDFFKSDTVVRNGCLDSKTADAFYNIAFQYFTPKISCPLKAGNYTIRNFPIMTTNITSTESKISTSVFGFTHSIIGYNDDEERIFCLESHLRLNYFRNHDWIQGMTYGVRAVPSQSARGRNPDSIERTDDFASDAKHEDDEYEDILDRE